MKFRIILLLGILLIGSTGCSPVVQSVQPAQTDGIVLDSQNSVGQTFVARYAGLNGIQVSLSPNQAGDGLVTLHLRTDAQAEEDLVRVVMPIDQVIEAIPYRYDFPAIKNSSQQYYYAVLEVEGSGSLWVSASAGNTYQDGALYQQGTPRDGQLAFSLEYDPGSLAIGLLQELFRWAGVVGLSVLLYILPGWAVLGWLWRGWDRLAWMEKLGLGAGLSLALYGVVMLFTHLGGLQLGAGYAWGGVVVGVVGTIWRSLRKEGLHARWLKLCKGIRQPGKHLKTILAELVLIALVGLIFITRWWAIREIEAPMWGDSVQHAVMAQLMVDNNGLFQDWSPYTPYSSLTVQHVFSEAVALFTWLTGMEAWRATLWVGQILNGLSILVMYPLAVKIASGNRWAGWGAVFVAGLVSPLPAFYVNWGRYAQLTGQVILPVVMYFTWETLETKREVGAINRTGLAGARQFGGQIDWRQVAVGGVGIAGMLLAYYRTAYYFAVFVLLLGMIFGIARWKFNWKEWLLAATKLVSLAILAVILFLPWFVQMSGSTLVASMETNPTGNRDLQAILTSYQGTYETTFYHYPRQLFIYAGLCLVWGLIRRRWLVVMAGLWAGGMTLLPAGELIGLPGANFITHFSIIILLYIPIGIVGGWFLGQLIDWLWEKSRIFLYLVTIGVLIIGAAWYAWELRDLPQPEFFAMVTRPDVSAMKWIEDNAPEDARFLVEGFRIYNGNSAVGSDAGWWITLLAKRQNTMPPQYALLDEEPLDSNYTQQIVDIVAALETTQLDSVEGIAVLCDHGISHVYIGQSQGLVAAGPVIQLYSPDELLAQPLFNLVYQMDRVYIFALKAEACEGN